MYNFQRTFIDEILIKRLWNEYLLFVSSKNQTRVFPGCSPDLSEGSSQPLHKETMEALDHKNAMGYMQDLGKCIVEILSGIHSVEHNLLLVFCSSFQENCLDIFQRMESTEKLNENVERFIKFLFLLDQHAVQKGETWPLVDLVGPALAKSFPLIKTLDSPDSVRFIVAAVSIFGPRKIIGEFICKEFKIEHFIECFKEIFIPWCLQKNSSSNGARVELLLALICDESFSEQWDSVIAHAVKVDDVVAGARTLEPDCISVLAMLIEKAREEIRKRKVDMDLDHRQGSHSEHWHHELLDSAAASVARSFPPFEISDANFLRLVLGGAMEGDQTSFVTRSTSILIFEEVFRKLLTFVMDSTFSWVRSAGSLLIAEGIDSKLQYESSINVLGMAHFALEVLSGSFFCIKSFGNEIGLVPGLLATIWVIDWECSMASVSNDELDGESSEKTKARLGCCESVHTFRCKIGNQFFKSLSTDIRHRLGNVLIQSIKSAIFKEEKVDIDKMISLCCSWMLEVLECLCQDQFEEQILLDQFLNKSDLWPLWIIPDVSNGKRSATLKTENLSLKVSGFCL
ncbi:unnamed protein product [Ilex paraguariensis]|uniref:E3 ubiquitin-protein ligase listerin n=1 Tax=Ilex paraguariensis TaxID=185542 RepID=A0ABC8TBX8_9AQUA